MTPVFNISTAAGALLGATAVDLYPTEAALWVPLVLVLLAALAAKRSQEPSPPLWKES